MINISLLLSAPVRADRRALRERDALSETFEVSRIVARRALDILEADGLINRVRGGGAFVRRYQQLVRKSALHYKSGPGAPFAEEALA